MRPIQVQLVVVAIAMLAASSAQGGMLYSVDIGTDELVSIDSSNGRSRWFCIGL